MDWRENEGSCPQIAAILCSFISLQNTGRAKYISFVLRDELPSPHAQLYWTKLYWIGWDKSMQFVLSTDSSYDAIWFLRHKFYNYLSITLLSVAVFNWLRSLTFTRKLDTQKSVSYLFLPLLRGFLYGQGQTAVLRLSPCAKSAASGPTGIWKAL